MRAYKRPKHVEIIYFTGTGGTKMIAEAFAKNFAEQGISVYSHEIHKKNTYQKQNSDLLMILYPVYALNAPKPIYDFIEELTRKKEKPAVVISISGGGEISPNTASRVHCIRRLQKKGYRVVYERMMVMPSNIFVKTPEDLAAQLLAILPIKVKHITEDLLSGKTRRTKPNYIDLFLSMLGELEKGVMGAKFFGKHIIADGNCNGCGLCERSCPTGNIKLHNKKPIYSSKCSLCLRCIYDCPKRALSLKYIKFFSLKDGYSLKNFTNNTNQKSSDKVSAKSGIAFSGISKYLSEKD